MAVTSPDASLPQTDTVDIRALSAEASRLIGPARWLAVLAFLILAERIFVYTPDDAYITFRYSRSLAEGYGPVFNPAAPTEDRTEGYSCPLYMLLLALLWKLPLGLDMLFRAKLVGLLCGAGTLLLLPGLARSLHMPTWAQALAPLLAALHPNFLVNSVDGMESALIAFLTALAVTLFAREWQAGEEAGKRAGWTSGLVFAACALTRPEGILFGLLALGLLLWGRKGRLDTRDARWLLAFLAPVLCYFLWRRWYYGDWLPNTYYAKNPPLEMTLRQGFAYLLNSCFSYGYNALYIGISIGWWLLILAGAVATRFQRSPGLLVPLIALAQIVFVLKSGGDWMTGWRYMAAALPLLLLLAVSGVVEIAEGVQRIAKGRVGAARIVAAGLCAALLATYALGWRDYSSAKAREDGMRSWASKGFTLDEREILRGWFIEMALGTSDWLNRNVPPRSVVAYTEMGVTPYFSPNVWFLDARGLTDRGVARLPGTSRDRTGVSTPYTQETVLGDYLAAERRPDYILWGARNGHRYHPPRAILNDSYTLFGAFSTPPKHTGKMAIWKRSDIPGE